MPAPLAAKRNQVFMVTFGALHLQESVFQPAAFEVVLKLALHIARQLPAPLRQMGGEGRIVLFNNLVEQRLLGAVALVLGSGRIGRRRLSIFMLVTIPISISPLGKL